MNEFNKVSWSEFYYDLILLIEKYENEVPNLDIYINQALVKYKQENKNPVRGS